MFTEIIPKTVGAAYAGNLAGFAGFTIGMMIKPPMKWILVVTRALTRLVAPKTTPVITRGDVAATVEIAARDGSLATDESTVLSNLLKLDGIRVEDVMTPRPVLVMLEVDETVEKAVAEPETKSYSRIPVYREKRDEIEGYVLVRDLMEAALTETGRNRKVSEFLRPISVVGESLSVGKALKRHTETKEQLSIVIDQHGALRGLVTLEDLFETAFGVEIVDELDEVADLRQKAVRMREQRMARMKERWPGSGVR